MRGGRAAFGRDGKSRPPQEVKGRAVRSAGAGASPARVPSADADKFEIVDEVGEVERIARKGHAGRIICLEADIPQIAAVGENDVLQVLRELACVVHQKIAAVFSVLKRFHIPIGIYGEAIVIDGAEGVLLHGGAPDTLFCHQEPHIVGEEDLAFRRPRRHALKVVVETEVGKFERIVKFGVFLQIFVEGGRLGADHDLFDIDRARCKGDAALKCSERPASAFNS